MADPDPVLCPDWGWTGDAADLDTHEGERVCPICAGSVEIVD